MDASAHMDDAALVKLTQGSPQAFDPLFQRYRHPVLAFCYRQLGDRDEAEDVASAAFVSALQGLPQFQDRGNSFRGVVGLKKFRIGVSIERYQASDPPRHSRVTGEGAMLGARQLNALDESRQDAERCYGTEGMPHGRILHNVQRTLDTEDV